MSAALPVYEILVQKYRQRFSGFQILKKTYILWVNTNFMFWRKIPKIIQFWVLDTSKTTAKVAQAKYMRVSQMKNLSMFYLVV